MRQTPAACDGEAVRAARLAERALHTVREERVRRGLTIDPRLDPAGSGLIGLRRSPVTTVRGALASKQTSINPNFAGVVVRLLRRAGARSGDVVAAGFSGSFPALNIAVLAAARSLGLRLLPISSIAASQYGANHPDLLWSDMELILDTRRVLPGRSLALSIGGTGDRGRNLGPEGREVLERAAVRHGGRVLRSRTYAESLNERMAIYERAARGARIAAYVNVGGGMVSVGGGLGKKLYRAGLNWTVPPAAEEIDSVMTRFGRRGVPVIHLVRIRELCRAFGIPWQPARVPEVTTCR